MQLVSKHWEAAVGQTNAKMLLRQLGYEVIAGVEFEGGMLLGQLGDQAIVV
jgi:hypothetical protein